MQCANIAARAGAWSTAHRRAAVLGWLAFVVVVVVVVVLGSAIGTKHIPQDVSGVGESARADQILQSKRAT